MLVPEGKRYDERRFWTSLDDGERVAERGCWRWELEFARFEQMDQARGALGKLFDGGGC